MITLKDVARECNVSFSTVSKALRGSSEISKETRDMVRGKAREMGYHPNLAAQTLRTNCTHDIGVIFEDVTGSGLRHQYFAMIFGSIQAAAMAKGYDLTFMGSARGSEMDYYEHCQYRNFDGVAILSTTFERDDIQSLIMSDIPTVTLDYALDDVHYAVMNDNRMGMKSLVEYVISKGHTRIAFVHGENTYVTRERISAFMDVMASHCISVPASYLIESIYHDPRTSGQAARSLIELPELPTCILFPDDISALGGIHTLNNSGYAIGRDISVAGYDGIMLSSLLTPPLTTYRQPSGMIGELIVQCLMEQIDKNHKAAKREEMTAKLNSVTEFIEERSMDETDDPMVRCRSSTDIADADAISLVRHKEVTGELVKGASVADI